MFKKWVLWKKLTKFQRISEKFLDYLKFLFLTEKITNVRNSKKKYQKRKNPETVKNECSGKIFYFLIHAPSNSLSMSQKLQSRSKSSE